MKRFFIILIASVALGAGAGCALTERGPNGEPSPLEQGVSEGVSTAAGQAARGNWTGALIGGLLSAVTATGGALITKRRKDKEIERYVRAVQRHVSNTPFDLYKDQGVEDIVDAERERLLDAIAEELDEKDKARFERIRQRIGDIL